MGVAAAVLEKTKASVPVKTIAPESFRDQMQNVFDAVSRKAYEIFESNGRSFGHDIEDWFQAENELFEPLHTDITESDESFSVKVEVPGFTERELQVAIVAGHLVISGKHDSNKEEKNGKMTRSEACSREIFSVIDLPTEVNTGKATATLKDSILELTIPKAAKVQAEQSKPQAAA
jgi:HSP20 family protein